MSKMSKKAESRKIGLVGMKKVKSRKLVAKRNMYTSTSGPGWPQKITDEDVYWMLSSKNTEF